MTSNTMLRAAAAVALISGSLVYLNRPVDAQLPVPEMVDPELGVRTAVAGLTTPIGLAFLPRGGARRSGEDLDCRIVTAPAEIGSVYAPNRRAGPAATMFVIEKSTGQVKLVVDGARYRRPCSISRSTSRPSADCSASRCTRAFRSGRTSTSTGPVARRRRPPIRSAPTPAPCDERAMLGEDTNADPAGAAARQSRRSLRLGRRDADLRSKHRSRCARSRPTARRSRRPERRGAESRRQSQRRSHSLRPGRQALRRHRRQRPARLAAEPRRGADAAVAPTTSSAVPSPTMRISRASCCG